MSTNVICLLAHCQSLTPVSSAGDWGFAMITIQTESTKITSAAEQELCLSEPFGILKVFDNRPGYLLRNQLSNDTLQS